MGTLGAVRFFLSGVAGGGVGKRRFSPIAHVTIDFTFCASLHFLSVYFFSVYTRSISMDVGGLNDLQFLKAAMPHSLAMPID